MGPGPVAGERKPRLNSTRAFGDHATESTPARNSSQDPRKSLSNRALPGKSIKNPRISLLASQEKELESSIENMSIDDIAEEDIPDDDVTDATESDRLLIDESAVVKPTKNETYNKSVWKIN